MVSLFQGRDNLTPYCYPQAMEYYEKQTAARWELSDINFDKDVVQWQSIDPTVKDVISGVLRGFVQTEHVVGEYWSGNIPRWFPHPEICLMARRLGDMEGVHALSYNQLSTVLGLDTYTSFKKDSTALAKIEFLRKAKQDTAEEIAISLAIFSGITEGVTLFSSFAIIQWLKLQSLLPGVTSVVEYGCRDEDLHSQAGCWLFKTLMLDSPQLDTSTLRSQIHQAALTAIDLESAFIDSVLNGRTLPDLNAGDLKEFIKRRANFMLERLGSKEKIAFDLEASDRIATWFDLVNIVSPITDTFARTPTTYTKGRFNPNVNSFQF